MVQARATMLSLALILSLASSGLAQSTPPPPNTGPTSATTANPELERQLSPQRLAKKKQKRREKQVKQQNSVTRLKFMRNCLNG
jgi:hypothetical protein